MNKEEYLQSLKKNLIHVNEEEKEEAIRYYTEYFEDAGAENEQKVMEELGSPVMLARKIAAESAIKEIEVIKEEKELGGLVKASDDGRGDGKGKSKDGIWKNLFVILLMICSFPVWLPVSIVAVVLAFVLVLVTIIFLFCFIVVGAACVFAGGFGVVAGVIGFFVHFFSGITAIGTGFIFAGVGILLFFAGKYLIKAVTELIVTLGKKKMSRM